MSFTKKLIAGGLAASLMAGSAYASVIDRPFFKVLGVVVVWGGTDFDENTGTAPVVSDFVLLTNGSGNAGADIIAGDAYAVVTGSLTPISDGSTDPSGNGVAIDPVTGEISGGAFTDGGSVGVLDSADSLAAFGIDASTDVGSGMANTHRSSFYVASNTAFDIFAQATAAVATGDFSGSVDENNITFELGVEVSGDEGLAYGANAQNPGTAVARTDTFNNLGDLAAATKVFDGTQRTAANRGALASQSVKFNATYNLDADPTTLAYEPYDLSMGSGTVYSDVTYTVYAP